MPRRPSSLFALQPMGLGTGEVESFSSWVRRLAYNHVLPVATLLRGIVAADLTVGLAEPGRVTEDVNGRGTNPRLLERLIDLTGVPALRQTTLKPLEVEFSLANVCRLNRAWCRLCLRDDEPPHDRLAWALRAVEGCSVHGCLLDDRCSRCGRPHRPWYSRATPLCCPYCGSVMSKGTVRSASKAQIGRALTAWDLLRLAQAGNPHLTSAGACAGLGHLIRSSGSVRSASRVLGMHERTLRAAAGDGGRITLSTLIDAVAAASGDLAAFVGHLETPARKEGKRKGHRSVLRRQDLDDIGAVLREALRRPPEARPSLTSIRQALRVGGGAIRRHFPSETTRLLDDGRRVRDRRRRAHERERSRLVELIGTGVQSLADAGKQPTAKAIEQLAGRPGMFVDPLYRQAWRNALLTSRIAGGPRL